MCWGGLDGFGLCLHRPVGCMSQRRSGHYVTTKPRVAALISSGKMQLNFDLHRKVEAMGLEPTNLLTARPYTAMKSREVLAVSAGRVAHTPVLRWVQRVGVGGARSVGVTNGVTSSLVGRASAGLTERGILLRIHVGVSSCQSPWAGAVPGRYWDYVNVPDVRTSANGLRFGPPRRPEWGDISAQA